VWEGKGRLEVETSGKWRVEDREWGGEERLNCSERKRRVDSLQNDRPHPAMGDTTLST